MWHKLYIWHEQTALQAEGCILHCLLPTKTILPCRYELHIKELRLLDWYGGAHLISLQEYFAAQPDVPIPDPS